MSCHFLDNGRERFEFKVLPDLLFASVIQTQTNNEYAAGPRRAKNSSLIDLTKVRIVGCRRKLDLCRK